VSERAFPFSAVVGQDDAKTALLLAAVDPAIGGVLVRGDKGSAKSTLARALASLLPAGAPFVELPLGATEDRVIGTLDLRAVLADGETRFQPGLLAAAHGGVLYVDEVNLLPDHLVDVLLDVAVSGVNRVEREGVSHEHPARFVLVGSMNPEEGELRPQLLDRFGLCAEVRAPSAPDQRAEVVRRRLEFDASGELGGSDDDQGLRARLAGVVPGRPDKEVVGFAARLAAAAGAEGLRADLVLCRAAAARAAWAGRATASTDDVEAVAPLVLAHRARRRPFDPPVLAPEVLEQALDAAHGRTDDQHPEPPPRPPEGNGSGPAADRPVALGAERRSPDRHGRRPDVESPRGRLARDRPAPPGGPARLAVTGTVREVAVRRASDPSAQLAERDLREAVRVTRAGTTAVIALDTSGSMGAHERISATTGAVLGLLRDAYRRRDRVGLVSFRGGGATVDLEPTASVELARARLTELRTGGTTPLATGVSEALTLLDRHTDPERRRLLVLITDGRASDPDDIDRVARELSAAAGRRIEAMVLDAETGHPRLRLAARLAEQTGSTYTHLDELTPAAVEGPIRACLEQS